MTDAKREFRYTIAISIAQTIAMEESDDLIAAVLADPSHKAIIDGLRGRVEAVRLDHPENQITMTVRDVVVASDEWTA